MVKNRKRMNEKKAVSTLIATVLLILITVAAVGVIWSLVMPMLQEKITEASQSCISAKIRIDTEKGFTCYDSASKQLKVMISRGSDDLELAGLQIIAFASGNSYKFEISENIVGVNEDRVYTLNMTLAPEQATVAPIVKLGTSEKVCSITSRADVNLCNM
jgi:hypothetical protein